MNRAGQIVRVSVVSIVCNVCLAAVKSAVGTFTGSIAITLDAVNSLADALSSTIALVGAKIAGKRPDRNHPFGYGRTEYLASILIAALILAAGTSSLFEAVEAIAAPVAPTYTPRALIIVAVAALVKFGLGLFLLRAGRRLGSGALVGSGTESLMDGGISVATIVAGLLYATAKIAIEPYLAALIALLIIRSGLMLALETASKVMGERADPELAAAVEEEARSVEGVRLAPGLVLLDFGPDCLTGTVNLVVDAGMTVAELYAVARRVQRQVQDRCQVSLLGVTPIPDDAGDANARSVRAAVGRIVWSLPQVVELRGLYVDSEKALVRLDAIVAFDRHFGSEASRQLRDEIVALCEEACPGWTIKARIMPDVGD